MALFKLTHAFYEDNFVWCTGFCDRYLYRINIETGNLERITDIIGEDEPLGAFTVIVPYKNYFIFLQSGTSKLILMNRNNFEKEAYDIPRHDVKERKNSFKFANAVVRKDDLYIWGLDYIGIVKFNLQTKKFSYIADYLKDLKITYNNDDLYNYDYIKISDKIFLPFANSNAVLELLPESDDKVIVHYVGDKNQRYMAGAFDGKNIWLTPRDCQTGSIVKWNPETNSVEQFSDYLNKEERPAKMWFYRTLKIGDYIVMLSFYGKTNVKININTNEIVPFEDFIDDLADLNDKYSCAHATDNTLTFITDMKLVKYDFKENKSDILELNPNFEIESRNDKYEANRLKLIFQPLCNGNSAILYERKSINLNLLIDFLKQK